MRKRGDMVSEPDVLSEVVADLRRHAWAAAEATLEGLLDNRPLPAGVHWMLGLAREAQNKTAPAIAAFEQAAVRRGFAAQACIRLALLLEKRDADRAWEWIERALNRRPNDERVLFFHGWIALRSARPTDGLASWTRLAARRPDLSSRIRLLERARLAVARECIERGDEKSALEVLSTLPTDVWPSPSARRAALAELRFRAAARQLRSHRVDAARQHLELGQQQTPQDSRFGRYLEILRDGESDLGQALAILRAGQRLNAMRLLEQAWQRQPTAALLAHGLFLLCLHTWRHTRCSTTASTVPPEELGRRLIAVWGVLLHGEAFWQSWQAATASRYGVAVTDSRTLLARRVTRLLESELEASPRLGQLLRWELRAAEALSQVGGLLLPHAGGERLSCGPLAIEWLGQGEILGRFVAQNVVEPGAANDPAERLFAHLAGAPPERRPGAFRLQQLRRYFSPLGLAQSLLAAGRSDEALAALDELACARCRAGATAREPRICDRDCADFALRHPAYGALTDGADVLRADALTLAIDLHLERGLALLSAVPSDRDALVGCWSNAIRLARQVDDGKSDAVAATEERILEALFGRVRALEEQRRFDEAITLLEAAQQISGPNADQQLAGQLAELLIRRGIGFANHKPPRWRAAIEDLRRAVRYNPHFLAARIHLAVLLRGFAAQRCWRQPGEAVRLLQEGVAQLEDAQSRFSASPELAENLREALGDLQQLFLAWVDALMAQEDGVLALKVLARAERRFPDDARLRERRAEIADGDEERG